MKEEFDNKYLIAYVCNSKKIKDFMVLLNFYRFLTNLLYKTKNNKLYQIKLQWLLEEISSKKVTSDVKEVSSFKKIINKYNLSNQDIIKIIEAKSVDMDNFPFSSQKELLKYIKNTDVIFWNLYSQILFGNSLNIKQQKSINYMATAFGIVELIKFAHFKKSKGIYVLLYSKQDSKTINSITEAKNLKKLTKMVELYIKKSSLTKGKIKKILLLNYLSKNFISNLKKANFDISNQKLSDVNKLTYLKIILSLLFRL